MDIVIIGAGIGGLTAAALLLKQGHRVHVYEQATQLREVGAGLQLSANATRVMRELGLVPELEKTGVLPKAFEFRRFDSGELLHRIPLGDTHREKQGAPYFHMYRVDLHNILIDAVRRYDPDAIHLGCRAEQIVESGASVQVKFSDGRTAIGDILIGADGIKSVVRKHVIGDDQPQFTGQVAWRITIPIDRIPKELRPDIVSTIWCGPRNHAVMYYIRNASLLNFAGCLQRPWEEESWTTKRPWSELDQDYRGWHPIVRAAVEAADKDQCYRWALNNRQPVMTWTTQRTALLGDAAHATLPYMAQGTAMAIEDAAVLSRVLDGARPLQQALKVYEKHRAPRAARVITESSEMTGVYQVEDEQEMREVFHKRDLGGSRNAWLYPYDPMTVALE